MSVKYWLGIVLQSLEGTVRVSNRNKDSNSHDSGQYVQIEDDFRRYLFCHLDCNTDEINLKYKTKIKSRYFKFIDNNDEVE